MKVGLGLSFFQNVKELPRCLGDSWDMNAVCNNVDLIIAIEGRYIDGFEWPTYYSTDGSREIFERYDNVILRLYAATQMQKRQLYLDIAGQEGCDFLIVWDSDDYLYPDPKFQNWQLFYDYIEKRSKSHPKEQTYSMWAWIPNEQTWERAHNEVGSERWHPYQRVIKDPGAVEYDVTHYQLKLKDSPSGVHWLKSYYVLDGVRFTTDSKLRSREFLKARHEWAGRNLDSENNRLWSHSFHYALDVATEMQQEDDQISGASAFS